ncbi:putative E3 ubiquitin ligase [Handroanthus impetiginosus]|uniref:E3 ubiquitin-protein ligase RMA n=1 Tax=Handroanthus impetiginosus TaxID=429701 RepID=A0A2G9HDI5_9LAMI|nr:putative E3 ubiquitin ligase [Handroanthus impetiginosus]
MDDDDLVDVNFMDLDLNQEPTDQSLHRVTRYGSMLNELETAHDRIEERIRQLEAVTARARQRQRWRQARNSMETSYVPRETSVNVGERGVPNENNDGAIVEMTAERGKGCKRDSSHLVAEALEMDPEAKKADKAGGSFYDCNICLDMARDPILTCCGHLFCWPCFYQVSNVDSTSKECPVCKGEVSNSTVVPIYGNGDSEPVCETESGSKIPPRPKAHRVESIRQQRVTQSLSHVPVSEALRRIRISIGSMGSQTEQERGGAGINNMDMGPQEGQNADSVGGHRIRIHQVSRVLSESAASLSSLSSALSNAERLVEDLEAVINSRLLRNDERTSSVDALNPFTRPSAAMQSDNQSPNSTRDTNATLPVTSFPRSTDVSVSVMHALTRRINSDLSLPAAPSSSSPRRRSGISRNSDLDSRDARESRRRRLN